MKFITNLIDKKMVITKNTNKMIIPVDIKPPKKVEKIWGHELWIHNDEDYCGKLLVFPKKGFTFSQQLSFEEKGNLVCTIRFIPI